MKKKLLRKIAGLCAVAMLMLTPVCAFAEDLDDTTKSAGDTSIIANVSGSVPGGPTYLITIPSSVNFGTLQQPVSNTNSYKTMDITVTAKEITNLPNGSAVAVLVKDATATAEADPFKIIKDGNNQIALEYQMLTPSGNSIASQQWYTNGFLFNAFTKTGDVATNTLRINEKQLYNKDMNQYAGAYTGTLNFYTRIASMEDFQ